MPTYLLSKVFPEIYSERNSPKKYFGLNRGLTSNKPTYYLLDYGDLSIIVASLVLTYCYENVIPGNGVLLIHRLVLKL